MLPDDAGSQEEGGDTQMGLQQVGEGDTQQVTTDTQVEEGDPQTDTTSDKTTQTDTKKVNLLRTIKEGQKLPTKPKQTKNKNGSITSGKVHLYHSTNGVENLNNILENGIDFEKQKAVDGLFFAKLGSPYRQDDSFVVIETDIENIPFNQRTEGQEVALGQLSDYKIVHSSKMSPRELKTLSSLEMILNRKTNGGIDGYNKALENYKKRNKNSELVKYLEDAPQSRKQKTIQQAARDFNMSETGFFPRNVDSYFLKRAISRAEGDYGVKKARTGSFFLVDGKGRIVKDLFKRPQSRKQIIGENADLTALNLSYSLNLAKEIEQVQKLSFKEKLKEARDRDILDEINMTPEQVKYMTGWDRGVDNKWRYEIPDGKITLRESGTFKLSDVYDSKDLYKAYPQLKDMKVEVDIRPQGAVSAWFIPSDKSIEINAKPDSNVTSLLVHEIQHAIQFIEGFATGGDMRSAFQAYENTVTPEEKRAEIELKEEVEVLRNLSTVLEMASIDFEGMSLDEVLDLDFMQENFDALGLEEVGDAVNVYEYVNIDNPQIINKLKKDDFGYSLNLEESFEEASFIAGEKQAEYSDKYSTYGLYQRLAGEVESRNVEKRYGMREEKRRQTLLEATEDVAREDQILLFPDAPQSRKQKPSGKKKPSKKPTRKRTSSIKKAITEIKNVLKITPDEQRKIFKALNDQKKIAKDIKKAIVASL